jgi:predicted GNAT family acetyltransferase
MTLELDNIEHEEYGDGGAFFIVREGRRVGEMRYRLKSGGVALIDHTEVSPELRRRGIGRALIEAAVEWARATETKVSATCSFARDQFAKDPSIRDVLAEERETGETTRRADRG